MSEGDLYLSRHPLERDRFERGGFETDRERERSRASEREERLSRKSEEEKKEEESERKKHRDPVKEERSSNDGENDSKCKMSHCSMNDMVCTLYSYHACKGTHPFTLHSTIIN